MCDYSLIPYVVRVPLLVIAIGCVVGAVSIFIVQIDSVDFESFSDNEFNFQRMFDKSRIGIGTFVPLIGCLIISGFRFFTTTDYASNSLIKIKYNSISFSKFDVQLDQLLNDLLIPLCLSVTAAGPEIFMVNIAIEISKIIVRVCSRYSWVVLEAPELHLVVYFSIFTAFLGVNPILISLIVILYKPLRHFAPTELSDYIYIACVMAVSYVSVVVLVLNSTILLNDWSLSYLLDAIDNLLYAPLPIVWIIVWTFLLAVISCIASIIVYMVFISMEAGANTVRGYIKAQYPGQSPGTADAVVAVFGGIMLTILNIIPYTVGSGHALYRSSVTESYSALDTCYGKGADANIQQFMYALCIVLGGRCIAIAISNACFDIISVFPLVYMSGVFGSLLAVTLCKNSVPFGLILTCCMSSIPLGVLVLSHYKDLNTKKLELKLSERGDAIEEMFPLAQSNESGENIDTVSTTTITMVHEPLQLSYAGLALLCSFQGIWATIPVYCVANITYTVCFMSAAIFSARQNDMIFSWKRSITGVLAGLLFYSKKLLLFASVMCLVRWIIGYLMHVQL